MRGAEIKFHSSRNLEEIQILSLMFWNTYNAQTHLKVSHQLFNNH